VPTKVTAITEREPTIGRLIHEAASHFESKDVLVVGNDRITFGDLESQSRRLARQFLNDGVTKGERIALLAPNGIEWFTTWSALARIGAVIVAINTFVQPTELAWMIRASGASRLLTVPRFLTNDYVAELESAFPSLSILDGEPPLFIKEAPLLRSIRLLGSERTRWSSRPPSHNEKISNDFLTQIEEDIVAADPLVVIFTSGSTGPPKGVLNTHGTACR
jgi:acyl-CoA synthetase (AMP-forming)/AMP-acid ligase II